MVSQLTNNRKYQTSHISNKKLHHLWSKFHHLLESEQLWVHAPNLPQLCKKLDTNQKYLSQTINQATGLTIVSLFHCYRLERFLQKIRNGEAQLKTIEGLLNETGFKNRTSFYRAFKNFIGIHPREFIRNCKNGNTK